MSTSDGLTTRRHRSIAAQVMVIEQDNPWVETGDIVALRGYSGDVVSSLLRVATALMRLEKLVNDEHAAAMQYEFAPGALESPLVVSSMDWKILAEIIEQDTSRSEISDCRIGAVKYSTDGLEFLWVPAHWISS